MREQIKSLPQGWCAVQLKDVATHHSGNSKLIKGKQSPEPSQGLFAAYSASGQDVWTEAYEHEGDAIIISAVGARCGKCFRASGRWSAVANTHVVWPTKELVDIDFLWFKLNNENFWVRGGSAQPFVKTKSSFEKEFWLPPLNEQHRIVERIDALFAQLDQGEAALRRVQALLAHYRQSVLKAAVTGQLTADWRARNVHRLESGQDLLARILAARRQHWEAQQWAKFEARGKLPKNDRWKQKYKEPAAPEVEGLPELPEGWVWATLEQLGFIVNGKTPKGADQLTDPAGTIPWFKVSSMTQPGNEVYLRTSDWMFTEEGAKAAKFNLVTEGAIAFPKRGGAILTNKKRRLGCRGALDLNTMGYEPVDLADYIWAFFEGLDLRTIYDGSNVPQINYRDIADVPIAIPSGEEEADVIAQIVEQMIDVVMSIENQCEFELARSTALRQSILKDAFTGKLVPQDLTDEPASALLARIRAEREAAGGSGRKKRARRIRGSAVG